MSTPTALPIASLNGAAGNTEVTAFFSAVRVAIKLGHTVDLVVHSELGPSCPDMGRLGLLIASVTRP